MTTPETTHDPSALHTSAEVAAVLGVGPRRVLALCRSRGVGRKMGRDWVLTAADIDALRVRVKGRPKRVVEDPTDTPT